jgi:hydrogenase maturation protein HypF
MVHEIFKNKDKVSVADLACSAQSYLGRGLAELAVEQAKEFAVKDVGFSGGVAYNEHISATIRKTVENAGFRFIVHTKIPAGDGGTSFGQAVVAGLQKNQ